MFPLSLLLPRRALQLRSSALALLAAVSCLCAGAAETKKAFDLPAGAARDTLKTFARQAEREIVFAAETVATVTTNPVKGDLAPREALDAMLADTGLVASQDGKTGAFAVRPAGGSEAKNALSRTQSPNRAEPSGGTVTLERFVVTGSRITRLEGEGPQPVTTFSGADIQSRGFQTTGEFMQSLSFNSGTMGTLNLPSGVSGVPYARGATSINPRGLGTSRFLVLLDGRRTVSYGLPDTAGGSVFDFNSIPTEAIEGIDFLKDGGSAIYGTDAISGAMNIRLKKSYSGVSTSAMAGNTLGHDTFTASGSVLAGETAGKTSMLFNVNWYKQNDNLLLDYDRTPTTDMSYLGTVKGQNNNSPGNFPFNINLTAAQATAAGLTTGAGWYALTGGAQTATPTKAAFTNYGSSTNNLPNANRYDFAPTTQLTPTQQNLSALTSLRHTFNDRITGFAQLVYTDNTSFYIYTPNSITATSITTASGPLTIPAANPYNPFGIALANFRGRALFGPTRTFDLEATGANLLAGLDGKLDGGWTWTTSFSRGSSLVSQTANNQIRANDLQAALNGTLSGYSGVYFNPFGPSSNPAMVQSLFVPSMSHSKSSASMADLSATGPLFAMPALFGQKSAGDVAVAVGVEWRKEKLKDDADPTTYLVTAGELPFSGNRSVISGYAEFSVPVLPKLLDAQLAVRHDRYNDFGGTTNPKIALLSQPTDFLKLRVSYSESFKAPEIGQLYKAPVTTFTLTLADPLRPQDPANTYPMRAGGNRNLEPERGRTWYGGAVLDLNRYVKGLSFSADYFDISISNVITTFSNAQTFFTYFPNLVVRDNSAGSPGPILYFNAVPLNAARYDWHGWDFGGAYQFGTAALGDFHLNLQTTYTQYIAYTAGPGSSPVNTAGRYNNPHWTGNGQLTWRKSGLGASLGYTYKGSYLNDAFAPSRIWNENSKSLVNATFSFDAPWRSRVTLGCNNLFDTQPPPNGVASPSDGFDVNTYAAWSLGRFVYVKVGKDF